MQVVSLRNIPAHAGKTGEYQVTLVAREEHPRARGENVVDSSPLVAVVGTSPRTRGKQLAQLTGIPSIGEHPRARGENAPTIQ